MTAAQFDTGTRTGVSQPRGELRRPGGDVDGLGIDSIATAFTQKAADKLRDARYAVPATSLDGNTVRPCR